MENSSLESQETAASGERLDSWKEIASYLKRSVRSVQRYPHAQGPRRVEENRLPMSLGRHLRAQS